jgi:DhnA family fructose-bisphosphate aldolase class Ia
VKYNTFYLVQNKTKGKIMTVMRSHFFQQLASFSSTMVNIQNKQTMAAATSTSVMAASKSAARTGEMAWAKVPKVVRKICRY